jgi:hypothetical protein
VCLGFEKIAENCTVIMWLGLVSHPVVLFKVNLVTLEIEVSN